MDSKINPVHQAVQEKVKELLYEDLSKSEIRELIQSAHPNFPAHLFEEVFTEAFCSL
jgi:transposase